MKFVIFCILFISCTPINQSYRYKYYYKSMDERSEDTERVEIDKTNSLTDSSNLEAFIGEWMGAPYLYGGTNEQGIDCSAFTQQLYTTVFSKDIPRTSGEQFRKGLYVRGNLELGDLVFFRDVNQLTGVNHVGVYLGYDKFIHASVSRGVIISSLNNKYYMERFVGAKRL